jgi:hypothetical protein
MKNFYKLFLKEGNVYIILFITSLLFIMVLFKVLDAINQLHFQELIDYLQTYLIENKDQCMLIIKYNIKNFIF